MGVGRKDQFPSVRNVRGSDSIRSDPGCVNVILDCLRNVMSMKGQVEKED